MNFIFLWSASVVFALLSAGSVERARGAGSYPQRVCVGGPEHLGGSKIFARCCLMSVGHTLCVPGDIEEDRAVISGSEVSLTLSSNDSCVLVTWHSSQCVKGGASWLIHYWGMSITASMFEMGLRWRL